MSEPALYTLSEIDKLGQILIRMIFFLGGF